MRVGRSKRSSFSLSSEDGAFATIGSVTPSGMVRGSIFFGGDRGYEFSCAWVGHRKTRRSRDVLLEVLAGMLGAPS